MLTWERLLRGPDSPIAHHRFREINKSKFIQFSEDQSHFLYELRNKVAVQYHAFDKLTKKNKKKHHEILTDTIMQICRANIMSA